MFTIEWVFILYVSSPDYFNKKSLYFHFVDTMLVSHENLSCKSFIEVTEIGNFSNLFEKILTFCVVFQWNFMWYAPSTAYFNQTNLYFNTVDTMLVSCVNLPTESCIATSSCSNLVIFYFTFELLFNDWLIDKPFLIPLLQHWIHQQPVWIFYIHWGFNLIQSQNWLFLDKEPQS